MTFDPHKNFAYSIVATAPSPATSGTSLVVQSGDGTLFPAPGTAGHFNVTIWPAGAIPTQTNAEIVRVTARSTDTLTIVRAQEGSSARAIAAGDQIALTITAKVITDIETAAGSGLPDPSGEPDGEVLQTSSGAAVWAADPGGGVGNGEDSLYTVAASGSSLAVDLGNATVQDITLTANCTVSLAGAASGKACSLTLLLRQDATGGRKITWPGSVVWLSGAVPVLHTAAAAVDVVSLFTVDNGTTWLGAQAAPPGELDYVERSTNLTVTGTSGSQNTVIDGSAITFDGATRVKIEFFAPQVDVPNSGGIIELWDGATDLGKIGQVSGDAANDDYPVYCVRYLTPSAGSHTFHIKAYKSGSGTTTLGGGAGGAGNLLPMFYRVSVA